jgi:hypothetical protein
LYCAIQFYWTSCIPGASGRVENANLGNTKEVS